MEERLRVGLMEKLREKKEDVLEGEGRRRNKSRRERRTR